MWAARVVQAIDPRPGDVFLEIGPGTGALTLPLAAAGAPVLAVEVDRRLFADLLPRVPPNVTMLAADILTADVVPYLTGLEPQRGPRPDGGAAPARRFRVIGNLPYYIATPILFRLIALQRQDACFTDATLMVQREVAPLGLQLVVQRIGPGEAPRRFAAVGVVHGRRSADEVRPAALAMQGEPDRGRD